MSKALTAELFEKLRDEMASDWKRRKIDTFDPNCRLWEKQFQTLVAIQNLYEYEKENGLAIDNFENEVQKDELNDSVQTINPVMNVKSEVGKKSYLFQRNLRGGIIPEIEGFVPESIIRKLGVKDGDRLYATKSNHQTGGHTRYDYSIAEISDEVEANEDRKQYNLCPVEETGGVYIVKHSNESGRIRAQGEPMPVMISDYDRTEFQLSEGDLIDVAFLDSDPKRARVIWKHKIESLPITEDKSKVKRKVSPIEPKGEEESKRLLEGKTVLVVGEAHRGSFYESEINKQGGELIMADGKNSDSSIRNKVAQSDVVMCVIVNCSHKGMNSSKSEAKRLNKPFVPVPTNSAQSLVDMAIEKLNA